jgi:hypothetical protein
MSFGKAQTINPTVKRRSERNRLCDQKRLNDLRCGGKVWEKKHPAFQLWGFSERGAISPLMLFEKQLYDFYGWPRRFCDR